MSTGEGIGAEALALLFQLLESEEMTMTGVAVQAMLEAAEPLIARRFLVTAGHDHSVLVEGDDGPEFVEVFPIDNAGRQGYLDRHAGFVAIAPEVLLKWQVDVVATMRHSTRALGLPVSRKPMELVSGFLWDLGDARLGRQREPNSIWWARRLSDAGVRAQVMTAAERRPHPRPRVILTTTAAAACDTDQFTGHLVVSLRDAMQDPDDLAADPAVLDALLRGVPHSVAQGPAVALSVDGKTLRVGAHVLEFHGAEHIAIVEKLVAAHRQGRRIRTSNLTPHGLRNAFGPARWKELKPLLERHRDGWTFRV